MSRRPSSQAAARSPRLRAAAPEPAAGPAAGDSVWPLAARITALLVQIDIPVLLWGNPGCGKTAFARYLGQWLRWPVETVIGAISDPTDFAGLPVVVDDYQTRLAPPAWARRLAAQGYGLLFLDEINTAPPAVMAALLSLVYGRMVGDLVLPPGVRILAAANPQQCGLGGAAMLLPLANRFCHLRWDADLHFWRRGMLCRWQELPETLPRLDLEAYQARLPQAYELVARFISHRPNLLDAPGETTALTGVELASPSPRTWEMAAQVLAVELTVGLDLSLAVAGLVGQSAAGELYRWRRHQGLVDPEAVLQGQPYTLPAASDAVQALIQGVLDGLHRHATEERHARAWELVVRLLEAGRKDLAYSAAHLLASSEHKYSIPRQYLARLEQLLVDVGLLLPAAEEDSHGTGS